jgi:hypothetical protein
VQSISAGYRLRKLDVLRHDRFPDITT